MSYGYIILSKEKIDLLEKNRKFKFMRLSSMNGFNVYLRMEYTYELSSIRENSAIPSKEGKSFLESITAISPIFFMCFLVKDKEGDADIIKKMFGEINKKLAEKQAIKTLNTITIDKAYLLL